MTESVDRHWNEFYSEGAIPMLPSQFAAFVAGEFPDVGVFVDLGCGNGRDVWLFDRQGKEVVAVDGSAEGIANCRRQFAQSPRVQLICGQIQDQSTWEEVEKALDGKPAGRVVLYARFFLHAIDEDAQGVLLRNAANVLKQRGGALCLEYRTDRDQDLRKQTPGHFRRFIKPYELIESMANFGFKVTYNVEGYGFAKYKQDDAHVARMIVELGE
jgi:SAM-dependent methyltransferase